jgi:hypothetical protein
LAALAKSRIIIQQGGSYVTRSHSGPVVHEVSEADAGLEAVIVDNTDGNLYPKPFEMTRQVVSGGLMSGAYIRGSSEGTEITSPYPCPEVYNFGRRYGIPVFSTPADVTTKLFSNAVLLRPEILLPSFLVELKDIPGMIKEIGEYNLLKPHVRNKKDLSVPSQGWVSANFGWSPLVNDLKTLYKFADAFHRREQEIDRIHANGGARRRMKLYSEVGQAVSTSIAIGVFGYQNPAPRSSITGISRVDVWGTVRVAPDKLPDGSFIKRPPPGEVAAAILGLKPSQISDNLWELLPWSWLADYFIGVQDYIQEHSGGRGYTFSNACVMKHTQVNLSGTAASMSKSGIDGRTISCAPFTVLSERKVRSPVSAPPFPVLKMSPLSAHQLSILGALSMLRGNSSTRL